MRTSLIALALLSATSVAVPLAAPAAAQSPIDERRWQEAQRRFDAERSIFERERDRYEASRRGRRGGGYGGGGRYGWRDGNDWEPSRYYRDDSSYQERRLTAEDEVYRGQDGRYYCRRLDGTTGLVIGAGVGALIGRGIDTRGERTTGTVVGGVLGALIGREVERNNDMRCR